MLRRLDARLSPASALYRLARDAVEGSPTISGLAIRAGAFHVPGEFGPWRRSPDGETKRAWALTEALLARLRDEVEAVGSDFLIFYVPTVAAVDDEEWRRVRRANAMDDEGWSPRADADMLEAICQRRELDCLVPLAAFRSAVEDPAASPLYFSDDPHWTAAGHDLAARQIEGYLRATAWGSSGGRRR